MNELNAAIKQLRIATLANLATRMGYNPSLLEIASDVDHLSDAAVMARLKVNNKSRSWFSRVFSR
jgi:SOS-response transcriptional repressor LexA